MKKVKLLLMLAVTGGLLFMTSCAKDGEDGLPGNDGVPGANGTNVTLVSAADQTAYDAADGITGGLLYDHVVGQKVILDPTIKDYPNFFRCKQCHGWDLRTCS
jgi:hypothetical protein